MSIQEKKFEKGNLSDVIQVGNIIYRDIKPQSKSIHRLLLHLEKMGIQFCPRFLGLNDNNQEMLSFVEGETIEDYPEINDIHKKIITVQMAAKMLREYHDATLDFKRFPEDIWFLNYEGKLQAEVICHNDFAPYNVTFNGNLPIGVIDFDTACPAPRIWDVAYAVYRFVPLGMTVYNPDTKKYRRYDITLDCSERKLLLRTFLDTYGIGDASEVLENVIMRLQALVKLFDEECHKGNAAFIKMNEEGHQQLYLDEIVFITENKYEWI